MTGLNVDSSLLGSGAEPDAGAFEELIRQTIDPLALMQRVADQMVAMIDAADGALVGLTIDEHHLRYVCGAGYLSGFVGRQLGLKGSLSGLAIELDEPLLTADTELDGRVDREATRALDVRSSVCVPLRRGQAPVGILNVSSERVSAFDEHDLELLGGLAEFISTAIGAAAELMSITARLCGARDRNAEGADGSEQDAKLTDHFVASVLAPRSAERIATRGHIESAIARRQFSIVLQPVFDLRTGDVVALEALARFGGAGSPPPDVWLADAHDVGLGVELELELLAAALELQERLPPHTRLAVNLGPQALADERVCEALAGARAEGIVLELTEHAAVQDYPGLIEALASLRESGVRLAIDDAGAGFASLLHILRLAPDHIKLDRALISGIDRDPVRRSLAASLLRFAAETGAGIVAEGVETAKELTTLEALGIRHAQGFFLARPAPIADIARIGRRGGSRGRRGRGAPHRAAAEVS